MVIEHTSKAFDSDLQELTSLVAEMGGLAERQMVDAVDALVRRDVAQAAADDGRTAAEWKLTHGYYGVKPPGLRCAYPG